MKKIFYITTIIIGLAVVVMAYAFNTNSETKTQTGDNCWIEPHFNWIGSCVYVDNNAKYVIDMDIYNICNNPPTKIYDGTPQNLPITQTSTSFCVENALCTIDQNEKCFEVVVFLQKVNKVTNEIICSTQRTYGPYNCQGLIDFGTLNNQITLN